MLRRTDRGCGRAAGREGCPWRCAVTMRFSERPRHRLCHSSAAADMPWRAMRPSRFAHRDPLGVRAWSRLEIEAPQEPEHKPGS
eukprot:1206382-Prymnesium_polylepis.1